MSLLNTWQFNLIAYLISIVIFFQFYKLTAKQSINDAVTTIILQLTAGVVALLFSLLSGFKLPSDPNIYLLLAAACIFYTANNMLQTKAIKHLPISMYTILNQLTTVFLIIYGLTIFKEALVLNKIIGALIIIAGNVLALYRKNLKKFDFFIFLAIAAAFTFSIALTIDLIISKHFFLVNYLSITFLIPPILLKIIYRIPFSSLKKSISSANNKNMLITGLAWFMVPFFGIRAIQMGNVTTVVPLQAVSVLLNILMATTFMGEKDNLLRKIIAALIVIGGIYFTVIN